ncbi:MAG: N-acetyltransferase [Xanthomonadales bacterium]|nr:N-acetyltransferase [Xanthomonadales bacterium]
MPTNNFSESATDGKFYIADYAKMTFVKLANNIIDVNHTWVSPDHRGEGLAQDLYRQMIGYARKNNLKVIPSCSFVRKMFTDNSADLDLLA